MNPTAQYADAALSRAMNANDAGEIPGHGPAWACDRFGSYGHRSIACICCTSNFMMSRNDNDNNKGDNA
jgi:hypothetical protein